MLSKDGKIIQDNIADLQYSFLNIFGFVIFLTIFLSFIFSNRITLPISRLAAAADNVRNKKGMEVKSLIKRKDEIGELALSLDEMTKDLFDRMDAIASFAADVSHEIKNPLEGIYGSAQILEEMYENNRFVDIIVKDSLRLNDTVQNFLQFARPFSLHKQELDLCQFLNQSVNTSVSWMCSLALIS